MRLSSRLAVLRFALPYLAAAQECPMPEAARFERHQASLAGPNLAAPSSWILTILIYFFSSICHNFDLWQKFC
jgi:hypothetical protein